MQRKIVRDLVAEHGVDVVHEPIPVSPRQPSLMYEVGARVVIGPMNGGMNYPPAFASSQGSLERLLMCRSTGFQCAQRGSSRKTRGRGIARGQ